MRRWRDRACTCSHPRFLHNSHPTGAGRSACHALRCTCPIWDAAWAARFWARLNHALSTSKETP